MSIIKRLQRTENFWFGLIFSLQTRKVYYGLWQRGYGAKLYDLLHSCDFYSVDIPTLKSIETGSYVWSPIDAHITEAISKLLPEILIPTDVVSSEFSIFQALKNLEWKSIPGFTATLSALTNPCLRTPLCVVKGLFKSSDQLFIPCAGISIDYDTPLSRWSRYDKNVPLAEHLRFTVEGYVVNNAEAMNEFFSGKKLSIICSKPLTIAPNASGIGAFIRNRDEFKKLLRSLVITDGFGFDDSDQKIEIKLLDTGKSIII